MGQENGSGFKRDDSVHADSRNWRSVSSGSWSSSSLGWSSSSFSSNPSSLRESSWIDSNSYDNGSFRRILSEGQGWKPQVVHKSVSVHKLAAKITSSSALTLVSHDDNEQSLLMVASSEGLHMRGSGTGSGLQWQCFSRVIKAMVTLPGHSSTFICAHSDYKLRLWKLKPTKPRGHNSVCSSTDPPRTSGNAAKANANSLDLSLSLQCSMPTVKDCLRNMLKFGGSSAYVEVRRHTKSLWIRHVDVVSCMAVHVADNGHATLYTGSWDRTVKVWALPQGRCLESFRAHSDAVNAIALAGLSLPRRRCKWNFLYTASADGTINMWQQHHPNHVPTKAKHKHNKHVLVGTLRKHRSAVNALAVTAEGSMLFSGGCDATIIMWDCSNNKSLAAAAAGDTKVMLPRAAAVLKGHTQAVLSLCLVQEPRQGRWVLCSGSADKSIRIWSTISSSGNYIENCQCLAVFIGHSSPVKSVAGCRRDGDGEDDDYVIYSAGLDGEIRKWMLQLLLPPNDPSDCKD